jgi:hypothetical protein
VTASAMSTSLWVTSATWSTSRSSGTISWPSERASKLNPESRSLRARPPQAYPSTTATRVHGQALKASDRIAPTYGRGTLDQPPPVRRRSLAAGAAMAEREYGQLRVFVANQLPQRAEAVSQIARSLGHEVVALELDVELKGIQ